MKQALQFFAVLFFSLSATALTLTPSNYGYLAYYDSDSGQGIMAANNPAVLIAGESGGSGGSFGYGYDSFNHGMVYLISSGRGSNSSASSDFAVRNFGAPYAVTKLKVTGSCQGYWNNNPRRVQSISGSLNIGGIGIPCDGGRQVEKDFPNPVVMNQISANASVSLYCDDYCTMGMRFYAWSGLIEYAGMAGRSFLKYKLSDLEGQITSAKLKFFYEGKNNDSGQDEGTINLYLVDDYGNLGEADWDITVKELIQENILNSSTARGWIELDVSDLVLDSLNRGAGYASFMFKSTTEDLDEDSTHYKISGNANKPVLELKINSPPEIRFLLDENNLNVIDVIPIVFSYSDQDSNQVYLDVYYSFSGPEKFENKVIAGLNLAESSLCQNHDNNISTPNLCVFNWTHSMDSNNFWIDLKAYDDFNASATVSLLNPFTFSAPLEQGYSTNAGFQARKPVSVGFSLKKKEESRRINDPEQGSGNNYSFEEFPWQDSQQKELEPEFFPVPIQHTSTDSPQPIDPSFDYAPTSSKKSVSERKNSRDFLTGFVSMFSSNWFVLGYVLLIALLALNMSLKRKTNNARKKLLEEKKKFFEKNIGVLH